jgi:glycosyltransferase involved in cell wall biosynthesis
MRIAQIAPLIESCPPELYGGTERVVSYLTEELVDLGHDVTLFASGDSRTRARLVPTTPKALRLTGRNLDALPFMAIQLAQLGRVASRFDVIHFHCDYIHFPLCSVGVWPPSVTTLHGRIDMPHFKELFAAFPAEPLTSISDAQRAPVPGAHWCATVHHGLPADLIRPGRGDGGYLAFLGRISPEKRVDRAVEIARRAGMRLRIAAKIDAQDQDYFDREIRELMAEPFVEYLGEVDEVGKQALLGDAAALLFPIDWPEPFGLVMIEAMAAGTPVVAFDRGSAREVIDCGLTGFVVASIEEAVEATRRAITLDRAAIRRTFERRFLARRMAADYLRVYESLVDLAEAPRTTVLPRAPLAS